MVYTELRTFIWTWYNRVFAYLAFYNLLTSRVRDTFNNPGKVYAYVLFVYTSRFVDITLRYRAAGLHYVYINVMYVYSISIHLSVNVQNTQKFSQKTRCILCKI
jgi:hypothetical protein